MFSKQSGSSRIVEYIGLAACILAIVVGAWYGRKYSNEIITRKQARRLTAEFVEVDSGLGHPQDTRVHPSAYEPAATEPPGDDSVRVKEEGGAGAMAVEIA
jgi:hypothetical protein